MSRRDTIWSPTTGLDYMAQLDGLRALAVGLVLLHHFWRSAREVTHFGGIGVRVFFVLSGFLITAILLRSRSSAEQGDEQRGLAIRRFYVRRFLRIFPLYYAVIAVAVLANVHEARSGLAWHALYLSNVRFFVENSIHPGVWGGALQHLWSLAVEEQFYLVWPWVILFTPRHRLPVVVLAAIAFAPVFRLVVFMRTGNDLVSILTPACLDSLGIGAYLAMTLDPGMKAHASLRRIGAPVLWVGVLLFAAHELASPIGWGETFRIVVFDLGVALPAAWMVRRAATGTDGLMGRILGLRPLRYLGTISYGIYVYHPLVPEAVARVLRSLGHRDLLAPLGDKGVAYLLFYGVVAIGVAALSWRCFEHPINQWKDRFR